MTEIKFRWYIRWLFIPFLAWSMGKLPAGQVREVLDKTFDHRDEEWRRQLWALAAERANRKVPR